MTNIEIIKERSKYYRAEVNKRNKSAYIATLLVFENSLRLIMYKIRKMIYKTNNIPERTGRNSYPMDLNNKGFFLDLEEAKKY